MAVITFPWPKPNHIYGLIPCFLPFAGCPKRCLFCAQDVVTGVSESIDMLDSALAKLKETLLNRAQNGKPPAEVAFYGGTFTNLPKPALAKALRFARDMQKQGLVATFRCSTRPDAVTSEILDELVEAGFATVELGIQSFQATALVQSKRGMAPEVIIRACQLVRQAGLQLGVQLMPGMPGSTEDDFLIDVGMAIDLGAQLMRFYPCLVLAGTGLESLWRQGLYHPLSMEQTTESLARGLLLCRQASVSVIRIGLAYEAKLRSVYLAGPIHPSLGSCVQGRAFFLLVQEYVKTHNAIVEQLRLPRYMQGFVFGDKRGLTSEWKRLGVSREEIVFRGDVPTLFWHK